MPPLPHHSVCVRACRLVQVARATGRWRVAETWHTLLPASDAVRIGMVGTARGGTRAALPAHEKARGSPKRVGRCSQIVHAALLAACAMQRSAPVPAGARVRVPASGPQLLDSRGTRPGPSARGAAAAHPAVPGRECCAKRCGTAGARTGCSEPRRRVDNTAPCCASLFSWLATGSANARGSPQPSAEQSSSLASTGS